MGKPLIKFDWPLTAQNVCGHKTWLTTDPHLQPIMEITLSLFYFVKEPGGDVSVVMWVFGVVHGARQTIRSVREERTL